MTPYYSIIQDPHDQAYDVYVGDPTTSQTSPLGSFPTLPEALEAIAEHGPPYAAVWLPEADEPTTAALALERLAAQDKFLRSMAEVLADGEYMEQKAEEEYGDYD